MTHRSGRRRREQRGTAIVEFIWLTALLLVPVVWIVLTVFEVQRGAFATTSAARSAARAFSLAPNDAAGEQAARAAARLALRDQGVESPVRVTVSCTPHADCHAGGSVITVRVYTSVDLPLLPELLDTGRASVDLDSSHTVPIGRYQEAG